MTSPTKVGRGVADYAVGDDVLGTGKGWNCLATFTLAKPQNVAKKPQALPAFAAAVIPCVGTTAASLFSRVAIGQGTHVLINGAAGGIRMFATQMAVRRGATVSKPFPLEAFREAYAHAAAKRLVGKVIIVMGDAS